MLRVLIVDNSEEDLQLLSAELLELGCQVDQARHGGEALLLARKQMPDIVVSDLLMPVVDGFTLLRQWKADAQLQSIPFVAYSPAITIARDEQLILDLGADAFYRKPVQYPDLLKRIRTECENTGKSVPQNPPSSSPADRNGNRVFKQLENKNRELTQQNNALGELAERYALAEKAVLDGLWDWNIVTHEEYLSPRWKEILGFRDDELPNHESTFFSRTHPDEEHSVRDAVRAHLEEHNRFAIEHRLRHKDGTYRWVLSRGEAVRDANGKPIRMVGSITDISDRKRAEEALRNSEERYRRLVEVSPEAIIVVRDARIAYSNSAGLTLFGAERPEQVIGRSPFEIFHPDYHAAIRSRVKKMMVTRQSAEMLEEKVIRLDGAERDVEVVAAPFEESGEFAVQVILRDITERKRAEAALRESEETFSIAFHLSPVGLVITSLAGVYTLVNDAYCKITGYYRDELIGKHFSEIGLISAAERANILIEVGAAGGSQLNRETQLRGKGGSLRDVLYSATNISLRGVPHLLTTAIDITDRKQADQRIRQLNRTYAVLSDINQLIVRERDVHVMLDNACRIAVEKGHLLLAWIGLTDTDGRLKLTAHAGATPDTEQILHAILDGPAPGCIFTQRALTAGEGTVCNDIEHDPEAESWREVALQRSYRSMASFPLIVDERHIGTFNLYAGAADFFDEDELGLLNELARDISYAMSSLEHERERRRVQEELRHSEERFRALIEGASDLITVLDAQGVVRFVSPSVTQVLGYEPGELLARRAIEFIHPDDVAMVGGAVQNALASPKMSVPVEYRIRHRNGSWRRLQSIGRSLPDESPEGFIVLNSRDVTERYALEQQLLQSQKIQAMGTLAGGIAHDFNNLLSAILGNAELARLDLGTGHPAQVSISEIQRAGQRAKDLVQRILSFSRPQEQQLRPMQLQPVLEEAVKLLRSTIPAGIELSFECADKIPSVRADASQVHQIVLNLVTNAWHAMDDHNGRIDIRLTLCSVDDAFCQMHPELHPGQHVRLSVSDSGMGIDPATIGRIFEPFFTTKPPGQGAGLGLSVVHGIVRSHGGAIVVESERGHGATFHVYFPASTEESDMHPAPVSPIDDHRGHGEHILYVDDEEPLVFLTVRFLERRGYRVTGFTSATEALAAFRTRSHEFDLVITDFNMPGMSGLDLAQQLLRIRPDVKVALASGYLGPNEVNQAHQQGIREVVLKPNTVEDMAPMVERLLASRTVAAALQEG
jgi:PAS domain S-box-containing protein